jgi:dihydrofolate synthase/folylpolyglutamate synthase
MQESRKNLSLELFEPSYLVALDEIYHSHWVARKRRRIEFLKEAIKFFWPQGHRTKLIHVTGTNGKGSVINYLEQGFSESTGSWTGPHVFDYAERFHINGKVVCHNDIVAIYREKLVPFQLSFTKDNPGESLSFAELGILLALHLFEKYEVHWGMMEVGAGGRYTPLMALDVAACILTNIGDDHPKTLGTERWQRALEKAGIARNGVPFFTSASHQDFGFVQKTAKSEGAEVFRVTTDDLPTHFKQNHETEFTILNKALAYKVINYFSSSLNPVFKTAQVFLPARFTHIAPNIIADVAHNVNKVSMLAEQLKKTYPGKKFRFLLGLTRSRDVRTVFSPILNLAKHIVVTSASYAGQDPQELALLLKQDFLKVEVISDPHEAFFKEQKNLKKEDILVLTGSAYMIDQALNPNPYIKHTNATFGRRTIN